MSRLRAFAARRRERSGLALDATPPFFLTVSFHHLHDPFWPPEELWDRYAGAEIAIPTFPDNLEATYSAMDRWLNAQHGVHRFPQLRDPGEWHNLTGEPGVRPVEEALREAILARFAPAAIEADVKSSLCQRKLVKEAMVQNGTLCAYARGEMPRHDLYYWLGEHVVAVEAEREDQELRAVLGSTILFLYEYQAGHRTEEDLRDYVRGLIGSADAGSASKGTPRIPATVAPSA